MSLLGGALLGQRDYLRAEPLLLQAYEGLNPRNLILNVPPQRLAEAADRLIRLYESTNQPEKAQRWRESLYSPVQHSD
jgi:hypothetical protein